MKKALSILMVLTLVCTSAFGCGKSDSAVTSSASVTESQPSEVLNTTTSTDVTKEETSQEPKLAITGDIEYDRALYLGFISEEDLSLTQNEAYGKDMMVLMNKLVEKASPEVYETYSKRYGTVKMNKSHFTRYDAMVLITLTAIDLGEKYSTIDDWDAMWVAETNVHSDIVSGLYYSNQIFGQNNITMDGEDGEKIDLTGYAFYFGLGKRSLLDGQAIVEPGENATSINPTESITYGEMIRMAVRLYDSVADNGAVRFAKEYNKSLQKLEGNEVFETYKEEFDAAIDAGIITGDMLKEVRFMKTSEFSTLMSAVIKQLAPDKLNEWESLASKALNSADDLGRYDARLILYEAACVLGIGARATTYWMQGYYSGADMGVYPITTDTNLFDNASEEAPFEVWWNTKFDWDYYTCSYMYTMGFANTRTLETFFRRTSNPTKHNEIISNVEGMLAAYRLYQAYEDEVGNGFYIKDIVKENNDPLLNDAKKAKEAIISSVTNIVKSDTFIQGETYTGTAYYVSNSGDDSNDGMSEATPWKSMEKVSTAKLKSGDIVFFERGGIWRGPLAISEGVTYAAYGSGEKPIWTGSPIDAAEASKWTYYGESKDGGKIWAYEEKTKDCGVVILNGEFVARKVYPSFDGKRLFIGGTDEDFTPEATLRINGMFCTVVDYSKAWKEWPFNPQNTDCKGTLYFRCDEGNPGDVYSKIELGLDDSIFKSTAGKANHITYDNICIRCTASGGFDVQCNSDVVIQNCEVCWNGGGINCYYYDEKGCLVSVSGGGLMLFGENIIARNNYIHDSESKGIAVVNNYLGHPTVVRRNILAEGNVIERCGISCYLTSEQFQFKSSKQNGIFENVTIKNNYLIDAGRGWRAYNIRWMDDGVGSIGEKMDATRLFNTEKTGEVLIENNLIYCPAGPVVCYDIQQIADPDRLKAIYKGNTYVQAEDGLLYRYSNNDGGGKYPDCYAFTLADQSANEKIIREEIGDETGTFILKKK